MESTIVHYVGIAALVILIGALVMLVQRQNYRQAAELLEKVNANPALLNAIEGATAGTPQSVVQALTGILTLAGIFTSANPDAQKMLDSLKLLLTTVTDGKPN